MFKGEYVAAPCIGVRNLDITGIYINGKKNIKKEQITLKHSRN